MITGAYGISLNCLRLLQISAEGAPADPAASVRAAIAAESKEEEAKAQKAKEAAAWIAHKSGDGQVSHNPSA